MKRALVAGLGSIGQRHLRLLRDRLPETEIMVLRHDVCAPVTQFADHCTTSLEEAIAFAPKIAIIATPAPFHTAPAIALARAGTHLLVEKPIAVQSRDALKLVTAAQDADVVLQVGYNLRFLESLATFRAALSDGRIGRVASVRAEVGQYLPDWRPNSDWRTAVSARNDLGGGALLELSHEIDFLRWIFGNVASVRGWFGQQAGFGIDVEDTAHMVLGFKDNTPVGGKGVAPVASVTLDFIRHDTTRKCVAIGEQGTLHWDGVASDVTLIRPAEPALTLHSGKPGRDAAYAAQLDAFIASVEGKSPVRVSGADGVAVLKIVEAVHQSHGMGGAVVSLGGEGS